VSNQGSRNMILWFFLAVFTVSCFLMGWLLWPFVSVIILAVVVSGVFSPVYNYLNQKLNSTLSSILTCILIFLVLFLPLSFFVGILANEAWDLYLTKASPSWNCLKKATYLKPSICFWPDLKSRSPVSNSIERLPRSAGW